MVMKNFVFISNALSLSFIEFFPRFLELLFIKVYCVNNKLTTKRGQHDPK